MTPTDYEVADKVVFVAGGDFRRRMSLLFVGFRFRQGFQLGVQGWRIAGAGQFVIRTEEDHAVNTQRGRKGKDQ